MMLSRAIGRGVEMPIIGLGVWQMPDGPDTVRAVRSALEMGYRHLDTAQAYGNEASVGRGLREGGVPRDQVFITTKFEPARGRDPLVEAQHSVERLGVERLDLYLVHSPQRSATWAWPRMEQVIEHGLARAIGVSNFDEREIERVVRFASIPPAVNQIQFSPFQYRRRLLESCRRLEVEVEAYSPLTTGEELGHPVIAEIARRRGCTPAQVMLAWGLQRGLIVIPKSVRAERMRENLGSLDVSLTEDDMTELDSLDRTGGTGVALEDGWWTRRARIDSIVRRSLRKLTPRTRSGD